MRAMEVVNTEKDETSSWCTTRALKNFAWWATGTMIGTLAAVLAVIQADPGMDWGPYAGCVAAGAVGGALLGEAGRRVPALACPFWTQGQAPADSQAPYIYNPLPGGPGTQAPAIQ